MSNVETVECRDCGKILFEIEGKFATKKDGTKLNFLQKWEDQEGTITHWDKCEIGKAKYEAKKAQDKLDKIRNKTAEQTPAQSKTIEATKIAQRNVDKFGIKEGPKAPEKTPEQKAQEYIDKFGINVDNPTPNAETVLPKIDRSKSTHEAPPKVTEIMTKEQLDSLQLQRIENMLKAIMQHFKIEYAGVAHDTFNEEVAE